MKVRIKTPDNEPLFYETPGACGFDFKCVGEHIFEPGEFKLVETGTVVEVPVGHVLQIVPRSSTYKKHGLIQVNSVGIIDRDYAGDNDTIKFPYMNMSGQRQIIEDGTRIGQGLLVKIEKADFEVVESMGNKDRGGFGTTGTKENLTTKQEIKTKKITIKDSSGVFLKEIDVRVGENLLRQIQDAGIDIPYACSNGICGACMCTIETGGEALKKDLLMEPGLPLAEEEILTCVGGLNKEVLEHDPNREIILQTFY
ncbi:2Fe-2S iron-sulfur cluster binding domain-containing protein [Candidatus Gracilibacteria bacterium]|nr:2Fe-2S iron-sulfur cluster binding domain-containing protein [Candidatus Gracilibacteria bacterium]